MEAGLHRFGTDFGNAEVDRRFFQLDREAPRYLHAREGVSRKRAGVLARNEDEGRAHRVVLEWIGTRLDEEHPGLRPPRPSSTAPVRSRYAAFTACIQEDLAVVHRDRTSGAEAAIAVLVDFPSGWRPEGILGASFGQIHGPVPGFADRSAQSASMVSSMIDRGPYVRFVWTATADDHLDHHPEEGKRAPWAGGGRGWLRVERQVTVPFPAVSASLFLIRTYLYPFEELATEQRAVLRRALAAMPPEVARYKGLDGENGAVARRLLMD